MVLGGSEDWEAGLLIAIGSHSAHCSLIALPIQFLSGLVFQAPNILHGHSVPPVYPTENLPMEIGEESAFSFHDKALDTRLKAKPFEFGGN